MVCTQFRQAYLCIDALDEAENIPGLLKSLSEALPSMRMFVTGRHHVQNLVREWFKEDNYITIESHKSDILLFIDNEIGGPNDLEPRAMDDQLREDIRKKVVDLAKGGLVHYYIVTGCRLTADEHEY